MPAGNFLHDCTAVCGFWVHLSVIQEQGGSGTSGISPETVDIHSFW